MSSHSLKFYQGNTEFSAEVEAKNLQLYLGVLAECSCGWSDLAAGSETYPYLQFKIDEVRESWAMHVQAAEAGEEHWLSNTTPWGDSFDPRRNDPLLINPERLRGYLSCGGE